MKKSVRENLLIILIGVAVFVGAIYVKYLFNPGEVFPKTMLEIVKNDEEYGECTGIGDEEIKRDGYIYLQTKMVEAGQNKCVLRRYYDGEIGVVLFAETRARYADLIEELKNHRISYFVVEGDQVIAREGWEGRTWVADSLQSAVDRLNVTRLLYTDCGEENCVLDGSGGVKKLERMRDFLVLREEGTKAPVDYFETDLQGSIDMRRLMLGLVSRPKFETGKYQK